MQARLIVVALVGLAAFAWLVLRHARRSAASIEISAQTIQAYAQTLENSEARFRDVAEASSDWIWETDADLRMTYLSDRFSAVTGVAAATILGRSMEQFFSDDPECVLRHRLFRTGANRRRRQCDAAVDVAPLHRLIGYCRH